MLNRLSIILPANLIYIQGGQNASNANTAVGGVTGNSGQPGFEADHSTPQCSQQEHVGPQPSDAQVDSVHNLYSYLISITPQLYLKWFYFHLPTVLNNTDSWSCFVVSKPNLHAWPHAWGTSEAA